MVPKRIHDVHMQKFNIKCRNLFLFVIFTSFIFWLFLFDFHSYTLTGRNNDIQSLPNECVNVMVDSPNSDLQPINGENKSEFDLGLQQSPENHPAEEKAAAKSDLETRPINVVPIVKETEKSKFDPCFGRYIYAHNLPSRFNNDMLKNCRSLSRWIDMCKYISNMGLGPQIKNDRTFSKTGWFATDQFSLDVIFFNRMKQYKCLTNDSSLASAIYVPFFAGLDISRYLWGSDISTRDSASVDLVKWLTNKPEWRVLGGRDHFVVGGRITWDFRRETENESDWGSKLFTLSEVKNMTMLVIESSPWNSNDFGIPYPTYFHPSRDREVFNWQRRMRVQRRRWLFSFVGGQRPILEGSIRNKIIDQCRAFKRCQLMECTPGETKCNSPSSIIKIFQRSVFCLQPQGDSYTRRSTFDSILAGCIPVFFHPGAAYVQYAWHLPMNYTSYSVFIPENDVMQGKVSIERRLLKIPKEKVRAMREKVIGLIQRIIYADPRSRLETLEDAFDITVQAVIDRVNRLKEIEEGKNEVDFDEENSWKLAVKGSVEEHEWERFFIRS